MTAESTRQFEALEHQAARLMSAFTRAGCEAVAPAIIQPADVFLDVIGEDLRGRTYVFTDPDGHELCLRPDLTVPTCRLHLARDIAPDTPARYCYNGPAFRFQPLGPNAAHPNEFRQAGVELIAQQDAAAADTEVLRLILDALAEVGLGAFRVRIGDLALFHALLADLDMPERARQRLRAHFWRPEAFRAALTRLTVSPAGSLAGLPADLVARLDTSDPSGAETIVASYLEAHGIEPIGARSVSEVTAGLLAAAEDSRSEPIAPDAAALIDRYLGIRGPAPEATNRAVELLAGCGPRTAAAVAAQRRRLELMTAAGLDVSTFEFSAEFGRNLEYYTGFVFDIVTDALGLASPIAGGGRYDDLMSAVGAPQQIPAVGSAIHTERLLAVVNGGPR